MTQPGETDNLDVYQHIKVIEKQLSNFGVKNRIFNAILSQIQFEKSPLVDYYQSRGAVPVVCNKEELISKGFILRSTNNGFWMYFYIFFDHCGSQ